MTPRFLPLLLGLLLAGAALLLHAGSASAKDEDLLTIEGPIRVDLRERVVFIPPLTIRVTKATTIELNWEEVDLETLAAFLERNPGSEGYAEYLLLDGSPVAVAVEVDTSDYAIGVIQVDVPNSQVTIDGVSMQVGEHTWLSLGYEDVNLEELGAYVRRNPGVEARAMYYTDSGNRWAMIVELDIIQRVYGKVHVDVPRGLVEVGHVVMKVVPGTSLEVNWDQVSLEELAEFARQNPDENGRAEYIPNAGENTAVSVEFDTRDVAEGGLRLDLKHGRVWVGGVAAALTERTVFYTLEWGNSLDELRAFLARRPDPPAVLAYVRHGGQRYAQNVSIDTWGYVDGPAAVDLPRRQITVNGAVLDVTDETEISIEDSNEDTLAGLARYLDRHPRATVYASYDWDDQAFIAGELDVYGESDDEDEDYAPRGRMRTVAGRLREAHPRLPRVGIQTRPGRRPVRMRVQPHAILSIDGARVPYRVFVRAMGRHCGHEARARFDRRTRTARRVECFPDLTYGEGRVVRVRRRRDGSTVTLRRRAGRKPRLVRVELFRKSLVVQGRTLVRPERIRRGDFLRYDYFTQAGRRYAPRVLRIPARRRR